MTITVIDGVAKVVLWQFDKVTEIKFKVWFEEAPETVTVAKPLLFKVAITFEPVPIL